jgi:hypothetical protein
MKLYLALKNLKALSSIDALLSGSAGVEHYLSANHSNEPNFIHYQTILKSEKTLQENANKLFYEDKPLKKLIKGVYFGNDTCEHLLLNPSDIPKAIRIVKSKRWHIVFRLPPMSQSTQSKFEEVLEMLDAYSCEVVINDFGVLHLAQKYPNIKLTLGRLFFKTQRNAFIDTFVQKDVSREVFDHQLSNIAHSEYEIPQVREMLKSLQISRVSLENIAIESSFISQKPYLYVDIYYPHILLACGRACESASLSNPDGAYHPQLFCAKPCENAMMSFEITKYNGVFLNTNGYYKSEVGICFEETIAKKSTSRLVWE